MSDKKYYTPEMPEFHEGFEYEMKARFGDGTVKTQEQYDSAEWEKSTYDLGEYPYVNRTMTGKNSQNLPPAIRVKYLDREDIESFGFNKQYSDMSLMFTGDSGEYVKDIYTITFLHFNHDDTYHGKVSIWMGAMKKSQVRLFHGILKNKSQLKLILQWVGILK